MMFKAISYRFARMSEAKATRISWCSTTTNPWRSTTLEWTAPIKHIHGNWEGKIPEVHRWAYDYSKPGHGEDFVPQHIPLKKGEEELQH